jgi:hypothetical protein
MVQAISAYDDGPRIWWDHKTERLPTPGVYSRIKPIDDGKWALVYSDGPGAQIRIGDAPGSTWGPSIEVVNESGYVSTNSDLIRLANGWLLYMWNARPVVEGALPYAIKTRLSKDNGRTWGDQRTVFASDPHGKPCWEPAALQLPTGEILLFFSEEVPATASDQRIDLSRSFDNGLSWSAPIVTSYRPGSRDGMAIPVLLQNDTIVYSIEDPGFNGFKPVIISNSLRDDWNTGTVGATGPHRWGALRSDYALPGTVYAGSPYLVQMPGSETVLSCQSSEGRTGGDQSIMEVYTGDRNARNFAHRSTPFPSIGVSGNALWNALAVLDSSRVLATSSVNTGTPSGNGIRTVQGALIRPENVRYGSMPIDGGFDPRQSGSPANLVVEDPAGARLDLRTSWDSANLHLSFEVHDANLSGLAATNPWDVDGVEVYLDPGNRNCPAVCDGVYKALVNIGGGTLFQKGSSNGWGAWSPAIRSSIRLHGTPGNASDSDTGYVIEMDLPWRDLGGRPATGAGFGMCAKLHDDTAGTVAQFHESLGGDDADSPSTWLKATLEAPDPTTSAIAHGSARLVVSATGRRILVRLPGSELAGMDAFGIDGRLLARCRGPAKELSMPVEVRGMVVVRARTAAGDVLESTALLQ